METKKVRVTRKKQYFRLCYENNLPNTGEGPAWRTFKANGWQEAVEIAEKYLKETAEMYLRDEGEKRQIIWADLTCQSQVVWGKSILHDNPHYRWQILEKRSLPEPAAREDS
jgi:hypothetical protein